MTSSQAHPLTRLSPAPIQERSPEPGRTTLGFPDKEGNTVAKLVEPTGEDA